MSSNALPAAARRTAPRAARLRGAVRQGLVGATLGTVALNVSVTGLGFLATVVLTRVLGAGGYGAYAFAFAWATLLSVPAVLGLSPLLVRNIAAYRERSAWGPVRGILQRSNQVVALMSGLVVVVAAGLGWLFIDRDSELLAPFLIGLLLVPLLSLVTLRQAAMQGLDRVVTGRLPETVVAPMIFLVLLISLAATSGGTYSATAAMALQVGATTIALGLGAWLLRRALPAGARTAAPAYEHRSWLRSGRTLLLVSVVLALNGQLGIILVGAFAGSTEAGGFAAASRVAMFVSFLYLAATYPLMPAVGRLFAAGRTAELQRTLTRAAQAVLLASLPIAALFVAFAPQVLGIFGHDFDAAAGSLRILVVGELAKVMTGFAGLALIMTVYERQFGVCVAAGTVLNLLAGLALVPLMGAEGAAIATALGVAVMNVAFVVAVRRRMGLWSMALLPARAARA